MYVVVRFFSHETHRIKTKAVYTKPTHIKLNKFLNYVALKTNCWWRPLRLFYPLARPPGFAPFRFMSAAAHRNSNLCHGTRFPPIKRKDVFPPDPPVSSSCCCFHRLRPSPCRVPSEGAVCCWWWWWWCRAFRYGISRCVLGDECSCFLRGSDTAVPVCIRYVHYSVSFFRYAAAVAVRWLVTVCMYMYVSMMMPLSLSPVLLYQTLHNTQIEFQ